VDRATNVRVLKLRVSNNNTVEQKSLAEDRKKKYNLKAVRRETYEIKPRVFFERRRGSIVVSLLYADGIPVMMYRAREWAYRAARLNAAHSVGWRSKSKSYGLLYFI